MKKTVFTIALLCTAFFAFTQNGTIRGTVVDDATDEALIGVTVIVEGTTNGNVTDLDGRFEIRVLPGTYTLKATYISYTPVFRETVVVEAGKEVDAGIFRMKEDVAKLDEIVVTAQAIRTTEEALLSVKQKSFVMMDGISSAGFKRTGDSDAASAATRVTGVSVEEGKYVYVRGLGDRYSKTTLNSMDIPGLDPDRNSVQVDLFPTSLIDNMVVMKSASADLPADFTGGVVNIETKDFPEERIVDVSLSLGYNPSMHFNHNHIGYQGSATDFLGFDNGLRALPAGASAAAIPSPQNGAAPGTINNFLKGFNPVLGGARQRSLMDFGVGVSLANQLSLGGEQRIGYMFSATYKNNTRYYNDVVYGEYQRTSDPTDYALRRATVQEGEMGEHHVLSGGLAGMSYMRSRATYKMMVTHLQNGESRAGMFRVRNNGEAVGQSGYEAFSHNLEYTQRGVTNVLLSGTHSPGNETWDIEWRLSQTFSRISDPDIRRTAFTVGPTDTRFDAGAGGNPTRIWRDLDERALAGKVDVVRRYELFNGTARFRFGLSRTCKDRDYSILSFDLQSNGVQPSFRDNPDPNKVLAEEHLYPDGRFYYASANRTPNPNAYHSSVHNSAVYVSNEFSPLDRLKAVLGLRLENYVQRHTGRDVAFATLGVGNNLVDAKVLNTLDLFPSANLIYAVNDSQNLRVSYARTVARPSFKELSFAQIIDPVTNRIFNGGMFSYGDWDGNLKPAYIHNLDLRWEVFPGEGQLLSVSAFYKKFMNPIELVRIPEAQTSTEYQPRNVGDGQLVGVEFEFRRKLQSVGVFQDRLSINANVTLVASAVDMTQREYSFRKAFEREGEVIRGTRSMAGQAPYVINAGLDYDDAPGGLTAGVYYHVKGPTLAIVGAGLYPDIYSNPFHSLDLSLSKSFGADGRSVISLHASNLLGNVREEGYVSYHAEEVFSRLDPGRSFNLSFKRSF